MVNEHKSVAAVSSELVDELNHKLCQLSSMLTVIHGCGYESFDQWNGQIKDDYLWACSSLADQAKMLSLQIAEQ